MTDSNKNNTTEFVIFDSSDKNNVSNKNLNKRMEEKKKSKKPAKAKEAESEKTLEKTNSFENVLSKYTVKILKRYKDEESLRRQTSNVTTIKVGEVLGTLAFAYERARNAIDYKGEHLLRRNAIERIIRRQIWVNSASSSEHMAESLIRELIWARYLENNSIPQTKIERVALIIAKYRNVYSINPKSEGEINSGNWKRILLTMVSSEIEEELVPSLDYAKTYIESLYEWFIANYKWVNSGLSESEESVQINIAIERAFSKSDDARIRYHLISKLLPNWKTGEEAENVVSELVHLINIVESSFKHPIQNRLYRFVQRVVSPITILKEIIERDPLNAPKILNNENGLTTEITESTNQRYKEVKTKVRRGITRSIIYIFLTKILVVLLIELPVEILVVKDLNLLSLGINMILPPFLMFMIGPTIKTPDEKNTGRIVDRIKSFVYKDSDITMNEFSLAAPKRNWIMQLLFTSAYVLLFLIVVFGIMNLLTILNFNPISIGIFFFFLSLVLLFGYRIRYTASELRISDEKEGLITHAVTILALPFLNLGAWLSRTITKLNVLMVFLDFIIEAPFKNLLEFYDDWANYLRERREEVVEVPMNR